MRNITVFDFSQRLMAKMLNYLIAREGCLTTEEAECNGNTCTTTVEDAMGFRYQVSVKLIGRNVQDQHNEVYYG